MTFVMIFLVNAPKRRIMIKIGMGKHRIKPIFPTFTREDLVHIYEGKLKIL